MTHLTNNSMILEFLYGNKEINMYSVNFQVLLCKNAIFSNIIHQFNANTECVFTLLQERARSQLLLSAQSAVSLSQ